MAKVPKSFRLEAELVEAVKARAERDGANESDTVSRLISEALGLTDDSELARLKEQRAAERVELEARAERAEQRAELLADHVQTLKDQLAEANKHAETLRDQMNVIDGQLAVKDAQIETANRLAGQAQELQAGQMVTTAPRLNADNQEPRRGFWQRLWS